MFDELRTHHSWHPTFMKKTHDAANPFPPLRTLFSRVLRPIFSCDTFLLLLKWRTWRSNHTPGPRVYRRYARPRNNHCVRKATNNREVYLPINISNYIFATAYAKIVAQPFVAICSGLQFVILFFPGPR